MATEIAQPAQDAVEFPGKTETIDRHHNASVDLSSSEDATLEAARVAWAGLKRTLKEYLVVAAAVKILRERADRIGGRKTFHRLMAEQGFRIDGPKAERQFSKSTATCLLKIIERRDEVLAWHAKLPPLKQVEWASPKAVLNHCPIFVKPPSDRGRASPSLAQLREENEQLKKSQEGGTFDPKRDNEHEIARSLFGNFAQFKGKGRRVATLWLAMYAKPVSRES